MIRYSSAPLGLKVDDMIKNVVSVYLTWSPAAEERFKTPELHRSANLSSSLSAPANVSFPSPRWSHVTTSPS